MMQVFENKRVPITLGALTALALGVFFAMQSGSVDSRDVARENLLTVATQPLTLERGFESKTLYPGRVRAQRRSQLGFERGGLLAQVLVDEGAKVRAGDALATLDQRTLKAQQAADEASVAAAKAALDGAKADYALAKATAERHKALLDKGHISKQRYDDARFAADAAQARLTTAKAQVGQAQAQLEATNVALSLSQLTAPFDGIVVKRMADDGTVLSPGMAIFDFEETADYEFVTGVPADLVGAVKVGQTASLVISGAPHIGTIKQIIAALDGATRTAQLIISLPKDSAVVSGQVGQVSVTKEQPETGFWVPIEALQEGERGLWSVFVAEPMGTSGDDDLAVLQRHPVELLYAELDRGFVRGAIKEGDEIVLSGLNRLISGQNVRVSGARAVQ